MICFHPEMPVKVSVALALSFKQDRAGQTHSLSNLSPRTFCPWSFSSLSVRNWETFSGCWAMLSTQNRCGASQNVQLLSLRSARSTQCTHTFPIVVIMRCLRQLTNCEPWLGNASHCYAQSRPFQPNNKFSGAM